MSSVTNGFKSKFVWLVSLFLTCQMIPNITKPHHSSRSLEKQLLLTKDETFFSKCNIIILQILMREKVITRNVSNYSDRNNILGQTMINTLVISALLSALWEGKTEGGKMIFY